MAPQGSPRCMARTTDNRPMQLPEALPCSPSLSPLQQLGAKAGPTKTASAAVATAAADVVRHVAEAAALLSSLLPALSGRPGGAHGHDNGVFGTTTPAEASCGSGSGRWRGPSPIPGHCRLDTSSERRGGATAPRQPDLLFGKGGATARSPQRASAGPPASPPPRSGEAASVGPPSSLPPRSEGEVPRELFRGFLWRQQHLFSLAGLPPSLAGLPPVLVVLAGLPSILSASFQSSLSAALSQQRQPQPPCPNRVSPFPSPFSAAALCPSSSWQSPTPPLLLAVISRASFPHTSSPLLAVISGAGAPPPMQLPLSQSAPPVGASKAELGR